jgi:hypothetical protein
MPKNWDVVETRVSCRTEYMERIMFAKFKKLAVVGAIAVGSLTAASAADASVVVSPSPAAITATATTHSVLTIHGASGTWALDCTNASMVGTLASSLTRQISSNINLRFSSCLLGGFQLYQVSCTNTSVLKTTGATVGGVTPGTLSISCQWTLVSIPSCTFTVEGAGSGPGSVPVSYNNATNQLTLLAAGQNLAVNSVPAACGSTIPTGPATWTAPAGSNLIYNMLPNPLTVTGT